MSDFVKDTNVPTNDSISRQSAVDAIWEVKVSPDGEIFNAIKRAQQSLIEALPSAQPQHWIPVTERLPEDDVQVLCTDSEGFVYIAWHCDYDILEKTKCWCDVHYCSLPEDDIIAWMPLPEPYAERREE